MLKVSHHEHARIRLAGIQQAVEASDKGPWLTRRSWEVRIIVEDRSHGREDVIHKLMQFSGKDLQAAHRDIRRAPKSDVSEDVLLLRNTWCDLLYTAFKKLEVKRILDCIQREIAVAVKAILAKPPARVAWRSERNWKHIHPIASNTEMSVRRILRTLIEFRPADLRMTISRNKSYRKQAGVGMLPETTVISYTREALLLAALDLQSHL